MQLDFCCVSISILFIVRILSQYILTFLLCVRRKCNVWLMCNKASHIYLPKAHIAMLGWHILTWTEFLYRVCAVMSNLEKQGTNWYWILTTKENETWLLVKTINCVFDPNKCWWNLKKLNSKMVNDRSE